MLGCVEGSGRVLLTIRLYNWLNALWGFSSWFKAASNVEKGTLD